MKEIWKEVKGFEESHEISNLGRVKSLERISALGTKIYEKILSPTLNEKGYLRLGFSKDDGTYSQTFKYVHQLVAIAFIPNPLDRTEINHIDGVKTNNVVDNIEWSTRKENVCHASANNLIGGKRSRKIVKLTLNGDFICYFKNVNRAAKDVKADPSSIRGCCEGYRNTSKGFKWEYYKYQLELF